MFTESVKELLGTSLWNPALSFALAALIFLAGRAGFALLKKIIKFEGLELVINLFLLFAAVAAFEYMFAYAWPPYLGRVIRALLFVFGVYIALRLIEHLFVKRAAEKKGALDLPRIVRDVIRLSVIVIAVIFALKAFLGFEPTALIATSTVLAAVIGLATQDVLANIFAGLSLQLGKPFRVGDWVTAYNQTGTVVSTSWRSTRIKTRDNHLIEIPNANIAKTEIYNYSVPTPLQRRHVEVGVDYGEPPNRVKKVLREAAVAVRGVLARPEPDVLLTGYGDSAITYRLRFWVKDFGHVPRIEDKVLTNIWYFFKRAEINIPFPLRTVTMRQVDERSEARAEEARIAKIKSYLEKVELLAGLSNSERNKIAVAASERRYAAGENIVHQGDPGFEFFIVVAGKVRAAVRDENGRPAELGTFGRGFFFGEMSLLTGEPRRATITALEDTDVLVLDKDEFQDILATHPKVAEKLSRAIAKRRAEIEKEFAEAGDTEAAAAVSEEYSKENVLKKIKEFFNIS